ncbi:unnamed protein product, partial [Timema podura]|nr:unnamed protein product [Timema podura]
QASEELEDRESLAQIAASGEDSSLSDGETYIEKYTRGVSAVESILTLDRLRQSVALKELLQSQGQSMMRKTASVPNFSQIMRFDGGLDVGGVVRSESATDLNMELLGTQAVRDTRSRPSTLPNLEDVHVPSSKPFGLVYLTIYLNLDLPIIGSLVFCEGSTLGHASSRADFQNILARVLSAFARSMGCCDKLRPRMRGKT